MKKIKKNNVATKNDIQKLDKKLGFLEKKLNGEIRETKKGARAPAQDSSPYFYF